jgi:hypothetical protein
MISLSSSTVLPFVDLMLICEFTLLDEPTDVSRVATVAFVPADGPILSDLKGELSLEIRRES